MYKTSLGKWAYAAGASGTVTLPKGAKLLSVYAVDTGGGGTVVIFGGDAIPLTAAVPLNIAFRHQMAAAPSGTPTIVFTGTDSYYVEYAGPGNP